MDDSAAIERFAAYLARRKRSSVTIAVYVRDLRVAQTYMSSEGETLLTAPIHRFVQWGDSLRDSGLGAHAIARKLVMTRGFLRWAIERGYRSYELWFAIPYPRTESRTTVPTDPETVKKILSLIDVTTELGARNAAMIELSCRGLALSEIIDLRKADYDTALNAVRVRGRKHGRQWVALDDSSKAALERYLAIRGPKYASQNAIFVNVRGGRVSRQCLWRVLRKLSIEAGAPMRVHTLNLRAMYFARRTPQEKERVPNQAELQL